MIILSIIPRGFMEEIETSIDIENLITLIKSKLYDVKLDKIEIGGEYLYIYGKIFDNKLKKYFDFDHFVDLSDFIDEKIMKSMKIIVRRREVL